MALKKFKINAAEYSQFVREYDEGSIDGRFGPALVERFHLPDNDTSDAIWATNDRAWVERVALDLR